MESLIYWGTQSFEIPENFKKVTWSEVTNKQTVYIVGTHNKKPMAYGPFAVHNKDRKELINTKKVIFIDQSSELLVKC